MFRYRVMTLALFLLFAATAFAADAWERADWNSRSALEARRSAVISAETAGRVVKIHREMGEAFTLGDVLVEIDNRLAGANLLSARASLDAAAAVLAATGSMFERKSASQVELEVAKRDVAQAAARLEAAIHDLDACTVTAPFDGRMAEVFVNEHELVEKGRPIVSLIDDRQLVAKFLFPEEQFSRVAVGDVIDIFVPVANSARKATLSHISPVLDPASRTLDVWAAVDNADATLRAGMTAVLRDGPGESVP